MSNKEHLIQKTLNDVDLDLFNSVRKTASYYDASNSIVTHRRIRRPSVTETDRISQSLLKQEEKVLIQYFRDLQRQCLCSNYVQIRRMVVRLLQNKRNKIQLDKHYI